MQQPTGENSSQKLSNSAVEGRGEPSLMRFSGVPLTVRGLDGASGVGDSSREEYLAAVVRKDSG